jgi:hydroxyacylglutathione hydrolase
MKKITRKAIAFFSVFALTIGSGTVPVTCRAADTQSGCQIIRISGGMANCYLIVGDGQCILVDTGGANYRKKIFEAVKDYPVTLIVLTHGHYDHIQNAAYLADRLGAKIAMHKDDVELITNPSAQKAAGRSLIQKLFVRFSVLMSPVTKIEPFEPDFLLTNGQDLEDYGVDGKIIELKGHTKGSIGILLNNGADFIVGDALMNFFKVTEPFLFENHDDLRASMKIIEDTDAKIYPGHGKCYTQS